MSLPDSSPVWWRRSADWYQRKLTVSDMLVHFLFQRSFIDLFVRRVHSAQITETELFWTVLFLFCFLCCLLSNHWRTLFVDELFMFADCYLNLFNVQMCDLFIQRCFNDVGSGRIQVERRTLTLTDILKQHKPKKTNQCLLIVTIHSTLGHDVHL